MLRLTSNTAAVPSLTSSLPATVMVGESSSGAASVSSVPSSLNTVPEPSSAIVPLAAPSVSLISDPPVAPDKLTMKVSRPSYTSSSVVCTKNVCVVTPAAKVSVWLVNAVKSPSEAVSSASIEVETFTVCSTAEAPVRVTVKYALPPSLTFTGETENTGRSSSSSILPSASSCSVAGSVSSPIQYEPVPSSTIVPIPSVASKFSKLLAMSRNVSSPSKTAGSSFRMLVRTSNDPTKPSPVEKRPGNSSAL